MRVVVDVEANGLKNPDKIWVIVCKDIDTEKIDIFRKVTDNAGVLRSFVDYASRVQCWIGHNLLGYDIPVLTRLTGIEFDILRNGSCVDTLICSKLVSFSRKEGHSLESYGVQFTYPKLENKKQDFFKEWSQELEDYCVRDVEITHRTYDFLSSRIQLSSSFVASEHQFEYLVCNALTRNGFAFNEAKARKLLVKVEEELKELDEQIDSAFPPQRVVVREFTPKATKFGTISKTSVPRSLWNEMAEFKVGQTYPLYKEEVFNPSSHKQLINVLYEAGWQPVDKTKTHEDTLRSWKRKTGLDINDTRAKLKILEKFGWKINENNLSTLPPSAPAPARLLAKRILLESRRRTLTEWLGLVQPDGRIHGRFQGIGAWTHRMAHQEPNTANIPNAVKVSTGKPTLLGKELRSLWYAPKGRLLVGVDAEAIQLRIFAHLINDKDLIEAIVNGRKADKTDPHSFNQRVFGECCKTRNAAKHSLYAIFFGGRAGKVSEIMDCSKSEAEEAISKLIERYPGLGHLEREVFPADAERGWFEGLDGRRVNIPGDTVSARKHLCMSGYLQNGESVVMRLATLEFNPKLAALDSFLVDLVHDEWQAETPNNMDIALQVAELMASSLPTVGKKLKLNVPLLGSYYNDDIKDYTIGSNWYQTH